MVVHIVITIGMVVVDVVAAVMNLSILWVVLQSQQLKHLPTNVFLLNLCVADLLACFTVLPLSIALLSSEVYQMSSSCCTAVDFLHSLVAYVAIWTVCIISIDRRFSIVSPMSHEAELTVTRAVVIIVCTWILSAAFAIYPHIDTDSLFSDSCTFLFVLDWNNPDYVLVVVIFCYLFPLSVMLSMYMSIFKVARKARIRVSPLSEVPTISLTVDKGLPAPGDTCPSKSWLTTFWNSAHSTPFLKDWKPQRTLIVIIGLFVPFWTPYFVFHLYWAYCKDCWAYLALSSCELRCKNAFRTLYSMLQHLDAQNGSDSVRDLTSSTLSNQCPLGCLTHTQSDVIFCKDSRIVAITWLVYITIALNPIVYGLLNRSIREETWQKFRWLWNAVCFRKVKTRRKSDESTNDLEDFLRFLESTSFSEPATRSSLIPSERLDHFLPTIPEEQQSQDD